MRTIGRKEITSHLGVAFEKEFPEEVPLLPEELEATYSGLIGSMRWAALRAAWDIRHTQPDEAIEVLDTDTGFSSKWVSREEMVRRLADFSGIDDKMAALALAVVKDLVYSAISEEPNPTVQVENLGTITRTSRLDSEIYEITLCQELTVSPSRLAKTKTAATQAIGAGGF